MTPLEIQNQLEELMNELSTANEKIIKSEKEYTESELNYKKEYAKAYLKNKTDNIKSTVAEIDQKTFLDTEEYKYTTNIKESIYKANKSEIEVIKIKLDTLRSLLSYQKSELDRT